MREAGTLEGLEMEAMGGGGVLLLCSWWLVPPVVGRGELSHHSVQDGVV